MTRVIRVGQTSPRVAEVRNALARLGLLEDYSSDLAGARSQQFDGDDAYFDESLSRVLKAFQQSRGILASGVIDSVTLRELRHASYTLGARVLEYQPNNELIGDDVSQLQNQLQELGFYDGRLDGHFGPRTYGALVDFQTNYGLQKDGICGPDTLNSLSLLGRRIRGGSTQNIRERETVRAAGPKLTGKRIVIDPIVSPPEGRPLKVRGPYGTIAESELIWDIARRVEGRMVATGIETIFSHTQSQTPEAHTRADLANAFGADLVITLGFDRYPNEKANGVATFYFGSEKGSSSLTGEMLSGYIQREIVARTSLNNCGNHARTWEMLRLTQMPTVEVFLGYLTNPGDVAILTTPQARDAIAEAIIVAVKRLYLLDEDHQPTGTYRFAELIEAERLS